MIIIEILKSLLFGIVEGITEWLPISSTGHMILVDEFMKLDVRKDFMNIFLVVIQLGAILATVILFWNKIWPFQKPDKANGVSIFKKESWMLWFKVAVASIPGVIFKVLGLDDICDKYFYNGFGVAIALAVFWMRSASAATALRTAANTSYSSAISLSFAPSTLPSKSFSSCVIKRSQFVKVCLRI